MFLLYGLLPTDTNAVEDTKQIKEQVVDGPF